MRWEGPAARIRENRYGYRVLVENVMEKDH
jgi:hypothetical protein